VQLLLADTDTDLGLGIEPQRGLRRLVRQRSIGDVLSATE
jgi:hypothetical protein